MFKKNFIYYCNKKGVAPTVVCQQIGLTAASYSKWTDESVPRRATLMRLADYLGVTVEDLLADGTTSKKPAADSDELNDIRLIADMVNQLTPEQLPLVLSIAQNIPKLSYDQLFSVAEVIRNMVK